MIINEKGLFSQRILSKENMKTRLLQILPALFVIQIVVGYLLAVEYTGWDVNDIYREAIVYVTNRSHERYIYFSRFPNNMFLLFVVTGIYYVVYHLFHTTSIYIAIFVNIVVIDFSIFFMYKIADILWDKRWAYLTVLICSLCAPFYLYIPIIYTDTFVLPFTTSSAYLIMKCTKEKQGKPKVTLNVIAGILLFLGYNMKPSQIILSIAVIIFYFLRMKPKEFLKASSSVIIGFLITASIYSSFFRAATFVTQEQYNQYEFPPTHFIMMGMIGVGGWNRDEVLYTAGFKTYEEKKAANLEVIKERMDTYGLSGILNHVDIKITKFTWNDGQFFVKNYLGDGKDQPILPNILHQFVLENGKFNRQFNCYTQSTYLLIFLFMVISMSGGLIEKTAKNTMLLRITLIGGLIFYAIWETCPRYVLQFYPFMIIIAVDGLRKTVLWLHKIKKKIYEV